MSGIAMGFFKNSRVLLAAAKSSSSKSSSAAATKKSPAPPRTASKGPPRSGGITKPVPVSPALRKFLGGVPEASRSEAIKKIWEHIKLNNLQNPTNKREILCDEKLKSLFEGKDKVGFLEIGKFLSHHFIKTV